MTEVIKIKNFEGYELHCSNCGKEIKHAYKIGVDGLPLGSECVKKELGKKANSLLKIANGRMDRLTTLKTCCQKQYAELKASFGENIDSMILEGQIH